MILSNLIYFLKTSGFSKRSKTSDKTKLNLSTNRFTCTLRASAACTQHAGPSLGSLWSLNRFSAGYEY